MTTNQNTFSFQLLVSYVTIWKLLVRYYKQSLRPGDFLVQMNLLGRVSEVKEWLKKRMIKEGVQQ